MSSFYNGGQAALAGYLYQAIGVLGMRAMASHLTELPDSDPFDAFLYLIRDGDLDFERLGQDALIRSNNLGIEGSDTCVLVQFKYSQSPEQYPLTRSDLRDITTRFAVSIKDAKKRGIAISGTAIVSNCRLSSSAQELVEAIAQDTQNIEDMDFDHIDILKNTRIKSGVSISVWVEGLIDFAASYGVLHHEAQDGIKRLVGDLFIKSASNVSRLIEQKDLIKAFTGVPQARPLTAECVLALSTASVERFWSRIRVRSGPIRRAAIDEIVNASRQHAVVILQGEGGSGKTVALAEWAHDILCDRSSGSGAFVIPARAHTISQNWIVDLISDWRCLPSHPHHRSDPPMTAIERIKVANPTARPPLLHLGLDGLDEDLGAYERTDAVRALLETSWNEEESSRSQSHPPRMTLVVTCRDANDIVDRWLDLDYSGYEHDDGPYILSLGDFDDEELLEGIRYSLPSEYSRIKRVLDNRGESESADAYDLMVFGSPAPSLEERSINAQILQALRHPVMWGAFQGLPKAVRLMALTGDPGAVAQMAEAFVTRFCRKVRARGRDEQLGEEGLRDLLVRIARWTRASTSFQYSITEWIEPACDSYSINQREARGIFNEARSGGLIVVEGGQWRWRHRIVQEYLASIDQF